jgi:hypothetical protein
MHYRRLIDDTKPMLFVEVPQRWTMQRIEPKPPDIAPARILIRKLDQPPEPASSGMRAPHRDFVQEQGRVGGDFWPVDGIGTLQQHCCDGLPIVEPHHQLTQQRCLPKVLLAQLIRAPDHDTSAEGPRRGLFQDGDRVVRVVGADSPDRNLLATAALDVTLEVTVTDAPVAGIVNVARQSTYPKQSAKHQVPFQILTPLAVDRNAQG